MTSTPPVLLATSVDDALDSLRGRLLELEAVVVAFSGGVDSALLARLAHDTLGSDRVLCATAVSPSLAADQRDDCRNLAAEWALRWAEVETLEMDDPDYVANPSDRCRHCKTALMDALEPLALREGATVVLGVNVDDLGDHRPGQEAAAGRGARFPMVEAGLSKAMVRAASRALGLRTWDKPAAACLASRLPYGTPVTLRALTMVERGEAALRRLGFGELRVRAQDSMARIEVPVDRLAEVVERRTDVVAAVRDAGFRRVVLDLEGFRSGNLNDDLVAPRLDEH